MTSLLKNEMISGLLINSSKVAFTGLRIPLYSKITVIDFSNTLRHTSTISLGSLEFEHTSNINSSSSIFLL